MVCPHIKSRPNKTIEKVGTQGIIINFLWVGQRELARHRVDLQTLRKPKEKGGVGSIPFIDQVNNLLAMFILLGIAKGDHPL